MHLYSWFGDFLGCNRQKHFAQWQQREFIDHSLLSWERREIKTWNVDAAYIIFALKLIHDIYFLKKGGREIKTWNVDELPP